MSELVGRTLELLAESKDAFASAVKNIFDRKTMATLKISELSAGDWVRYKGKEYTIASIYVAAEGYPHGVALTYQGICCGCAYIDYLEPIPITAEILEKSGFECIEEDADTALYGTPSCSIFHTKGTLRYRLDTPQASVVCWNIHDLQHALRLAGVDKEINL